MDQVLEESYNKTAKGKGNFIGINTQKFMIAKWNLIKHDKMQHIKLLYDFCGLLTGDEYSLYYDFSDTVTAQDIKFMEQRNNRFKKDDCNVIKNIATETISNQDATNFLVSSTEYGRKAYENFVDKRFSKYQNVFWTLFQKKDKEWETNTNQTPRYAENTNHTPRYAETKC